MGEINKELLNYLCEKYGFTYREIGQYIRITSNRDSYYILDSDYENGRIKITLFHENNLGKMGMHKHDKHKDLADVFKCIYSHDNREVNRKSKLTRLTNVYTTLN